MKRLQQCQAWAKRNANHVRGAIGAVVGILGQVVYGVPADTLMTWTARRWALGIGLVVLLYVHGWLTPTPKATSTPTLTGE